MTYERHLALHTALIALPALLLAWVLIALAPMVDWQKLALGLATALLCGWQWRRAQRAAVRPLQTVANLLDALRAGDYSLRSVAARRGDAMGEVLWEIDALAGRLREQRLKVEESAALLTKVLASIDIAIFAFDDARRLRLINPAGERLLARSAASALGLSAVELGLEACCEQEVPATLKTAFPGGIGSFDLRKAQFREGGRPHELLAISDLSRALREEERQAWQRLIRVLGHELNNSLAPIRSMAGTLASLIAREPPPEDWREDLRGGLAVIGERAEALTRFMGSYTRLARLPPPNKREFDLAALLGRVARLEQRLAVVVSELPEARIEADPDQLEQALINLVKNATEAALETGGGVRMRLLSADDAWRIEIEDDGPGLARTDNLFVPFFTTKPGGSGVGLVLAQQITENHGGSLHLGNREGARGCLVRVELPCADV